MERELATKTYLDEVLVRLCASLEDGFYLALEKQKEEFNERLEKLSKEFDDRMLLLMKDFYEALKNSERKECRRNV